jgi:hypothetical protein
MDLSAFRAALAASSGELNADMVEGVLSLVRPSAELILVEDPDDEDEEEEGEEEADEEAEDEDGDGVYVGIYGGLPPLPPEVDWPSIGGEPLALLAQLHCQILADLFGEEWTLPRDGVLLFFNAVWRLEPEAARVLHVPDDAPIRDAPDGAEVIPAQWMGAWPRRSLPEVEDPVLQAWLYDDPHALMAVLKLVEPLAPYHRHQVLGWLGQGYGPRQEAGSRPLLQLEGEQGTAWGELVRLAFMIPDEDLRTGRLDRIRMAYEVA